MNDGEHRMCNDNADAGRPMASVLLALITPLMLAGGAVDPALASRAASDALGDYCAHGPARLLSAAQVVGYGVAGLDTLRLSAVAPNDTSAAAIGVLRLTAVRLATTSARSERTLTALRRDGEAAVPAVMDTAKEAAVLEALAATTARVRAAHRAEADTQAANSVTTASSDAASAEPPAAPATVTTPFTPRTGGPPAPLLPTRPPSNPDEDRIRKLVWAGAMNEVAQECAANLHLLSPAERRRETMRISALSTVANGLTRSVPLEPFRLNKR
jgi:hypothetical protein